MLPVGRFGSGRGLVSGGSLSIRCGVCPPPANAGRIGEGMQSPLVRSIISCRYRFGSVYGFGSVGFALKLCMKNPA